MPVCYSFAAAIDDSPEARKRICDKGAKRMAKATILGTHTRMHVCANLFGNYHFLLKFEYRSLEDVARAVLSNGRYFKDDLCCTLTMLEYPAKMHKHRFNPASEPYAPFHFRGILLLRDKLMGGLQTSDNVLKTVTEVLSPDADAVTMISCINVFGPFDYVLEFGASDYDDFEAKRECIIKRIKPQLIHHEPLYCKPFVPHTASRTPGETPLPDPASG